jgi:large subunit ribosomal protein L35
VAAFERSIPSNYSDLDGLARLKSMESKMPKLKTKSGAKKRFKISSTGKVISAQAGKTPRHDQADQEARFGSCAARACISRIRRRRVRKIFLPNA